MKAKAIAAGLVIGFFLLLAWVRLADVYNAHFFDHGILLTAYQFTRIIAIGYLLWLQYALGVLAFRALKIRDEHFIVTFFMGSSLWHIVLLVIGLVGLLFYPVLLLLAGAVMIASMPHLAQVIGQSRLSLKGFTRDEKMLVGLVGVASTLFIFCKGTYPSGGHDFFNHYFQYYMEVIRSGNLGPHDTWYQYFYSKGLGVYFLSMILLDPFAIHLAGTTFIIAAACIVYDMLKRPNAGRLLPLWGVLLYVILYIYTAGRGIFAANGGWGDLEKTHEIGAVFLLAVVWLTMRALESRRMHLLLVLCVSIVAMVFISFASFLVAGIFFALVLVYCLIRKDFFGAKFAFWGGVASGVSALIVLTVNYVQTGIPQDQLAMYLWFMIDWKKVLANGYSLELYSHLFDLMNYDHNTLPLWRALPRMITEYYRLYFLWPLAWVGLGFAVIGRRHLSPRLWLVGIFLITTLLVAVFFGGRSQFISFFRFSTFNYAPTLLFILLLWSAASLRLQRYAIRAFVVVSFGVIMWIGTMRAADKVENLTDEQFAISRDWIFLTTNAAKLATGQYSLYEALSDQHGRIGRMRWGGVHPAMVTIYDGLPAGTRVWSFYNHSYCLLPTCHVQQYFSQVTSPRWYDIALGSIADGKKIMQEEGLNFFFYSRNINTVFASDTKDQLAGFYKGFSPDNIDKTFGILWTNGWDYLLTWKENATQPLDDGFKDSWDAYYSTYVEHRKKIFPVDKLAVMVKKTTLDPTAKHPPLPDW